MMWYMCAGVVVVAFMLVMAALIAGSDADDWMERVVKEYHDRNL